MIIAACALLAGALSPLKLDFEQRAAALKVVLQNLGEKGGVSLKAAPAVADEVVLVVAKGASVEEIKTQIAKALDATWTKASDADYLNRTATQTGAILERHLSLRRKMVDEAFIELKKPLDKAFDGGSLAAGLLALPSREQVQSDPIAARRFYDEERRLFGGSPASRLIRRLLAACRLEDLAAIGPYERAVFRASPTARQFGFDRRLLDQARAAYAAEQQAWIDAAKAVEFPEDPQGRMVSDPRSQLRNPTEIPNSFKLVVRRGDMANLFMANLVWLEENGMSRTVAQMSVDDPQRRFLDTAILPQKPDADDPAVEFSAESLLFNERIMSLNSGVAKSAMKPEMLELILHPDRDDPLSFGTSDGFLAAAKLLKKNIVASLSDRAANTTWFLNREKPMRVNEFLRGQVDSGALQLVEEGNWRRYSPSDPYEANLEFTPRIAIAFLTQSIHSKGRLDVRDYATYAYQSKRISRTGLGDIYLMLLDSSASSGLDRTDWNALRLYGSFDRVSQARLEQGEHFRYSGLSAEQKKIVDRIVYADEIQSEQIIDANSYQVTGKSVEPTEAFANGVPPGAFVYARVQSMPVIVAYGKESGGKFKPLRTLNEWTLASIETEMKGNEEMLSRYGVSGLAGYAMGANKTISLRVSLGPNIWKETNIIVLEPAENASPAAWDKLPPKVVESIRASIELKKEPTSAGKTVRPPQK